MSTDRIRHWTGGRFLLAVLGVVFFVEAGVMFLFPLILPADVPVWMEATLDAILLSAGTAPILWVLMFQPLRDAAESSERSKSAFLANTTHELRTPMTGIIGYSEMLISPDASESDRLNAAHAIRRNAEHLLSLINDLLDVSKFEAGKMKMEKMPVDVRQIVRDTLELLSPRAIEQNLSLTGEISGKIPAHIESDPVRLKQALTNLVGNAVKFTKHGGVRVRLQYDADTNQLLFRVRDSGIGIPADRLERIFEPFTQAEHSTTRHFGGTGLGLTLTRDIAQALGGDVTVRSQVGRGSEFTLAVSCGSLAGVQFVTAANIGPSRPARSAQPTELPRIDGRVLLVEDGPDNRRLFSFILRKSGAALEMAEDGREGLEKALDAWRSGNPFDVILMDMQMPVMDGRQATQELRRAGYRGTIIALTAHAIREELEALLELGCDHYLSKPIDRATLVREVAAAVRRAQSGVPVAGERFSEDKSSASRA